MLSLIPASAATAERAAGLKAAFLYRFASLATWPGSAFPGEDTPFRFGVVGDEALAGELRNAVDGKRLGGRRVDVETLDANAPSKRYHAIYLPSGHAADVTAWLTRVGKGPVLTISDAPDFVASGGIIQLDRDGRRIRFSINRDAAIRSELEISSKLLRLATDVIGSDRQ